MSRKSLLRHAAWLRTLRVVSVFAAVNCAGASVLRATPNSTDTNVTLITANILERSQFAHHPLDREFAGRFLDGYLDALDGTRSVFLKSDVAEFAAFRATLAHATRAAGDTTAARAIFRRYLERLEQKNKYAAETLKTAQFEFTAAEQFSLDRENAERPADLPAAQALWHQQLRAEYLQEKLMDTAAPQIASKLTRRYAQQLQTMKALSNDEVLEIYLNALAHVYDPHSDYMGREQMQSFSISMNLSLSGIGAALQNADGYCTIREVLPGGPAARSGVLRPGDRIIGVAQAGKETVDVVNMPLSRIVGLIRGPKGSRVTLSVIPSGAPEGSPPKMIALVRDKIQLEDQEAKARIIDLPRAKGTPLRLGVIEVPEFYANMGESAQAGGRSVTTDVALLVNKLKAENVQGIALDLRQNGGGSLKESITLTGLFIKKGPVVQTRDAGGDVDVESDPDPGVLYDGPLVVLTSRFSASASEILAGALQDYGRAVIVGDSQTFGKGTVQSLLPLGPLMDKGGLKYAYDPGALKITISKFYRPSGASTQLRGVAADVVLPSTSDFSDVSEASLKNPLPWDAVPPAPFEQVNSVKPYVKTLRDQSARRIGKSKDFGALREDIARIKQNITAKSISLNEEERRKEAAQNKTRQSERKQASEALQAAQPPTYEITLKNVAAPGLPKPAAAEPDAGTPAAPPGADETSDSPSVQAFAETLVTNEELQILADYVELTRAGKRGK